MLGSGTIQQLIRQGHRIEFSETPPLSQPGEGKETVLPKIMGESAKWNQMHRLKPTIGARKIPVEKGFFQLYPWITGGLLAVVVSLFKYSTNVSYLASCGAGHLVL